MTISPDEAVGRVDHKGQTYYFCNQSCLEQFKADPERFLTTERPAAAATPADMDREYTCPMDPEVRQKGPGACPKCGMALEPVDVTLEERNPELEDMTRRFQWSLALTTPILALMVAEFLPGRPLHHMLGGARVVGGVALLPARVGVGGQPAPQHVHAHCARRRRRLRVQRGRDTRAGHFPRVIPHGWRRGRVL
jgi:Cu+-exporting ATPase